MLKGITPTAPIVVLTGAGISKESGLATFRSEDGTWAEFRVEEVATPEAFARDPAKVQGFYNARRRAALDPSVQPNAAHLALARLEQQWSGPFLLVTQNVDDLHDRAGSKALIHMHGEVTKLRCTVCDHVWSFTGDVESTLPCPSCKTVETARPHIVWFGEMPFELEIIGDALARGGLFIAIGTSGQVYPAAGFMSEARAAGALTLEVNLEQTDIASRFHSGLYGPASQAVPTLVDALLALRLTHSSSVRTYGH